MNKKAILFSIAALTFASIATLSAIAIRSQSSLDIQAYDAYTITIHPEDITSSTEAVSGTANLKTDQLKNDISFTYSQISYTDTYGGGLYFSGNGYGKIYNTIGNEVRSIQSITIKGANDSFYVKWGFKVADAISYTGSASKYCAPEGTTYDLSGDEPNYFSIESGNTWADLLYEITITYDVGCVEHII